ADELDRAIGQTPRLAQRRIDLADVVRRDDREHALRALDTVEAVEQRVERQAAERRTFALVAVAVLIVLVALLLAAEEERGPQAMAGDVLAAVEDVVDVLDQRDARRRRLHLRPRLHQLEIA